MISCHSCSLVWISSLQRPSGLVDSQLQHQAPQARWSCGLIDQMPIMDEHSKRISHCHIVQYVFHFCDYNTWIAFKSFQRKKKIHFFTIAALSFLILNKAVKNSTDIVAVLLSAFVSCCSFSMSRHYKLIAHQQTTTTTIPRNTTTTSTTDNNQLPLDALEHSSTNPLIYNLITMLQTSVPNLQSCP